jgi:hypothetical protein
MITSRLIAVLTAALTLTSAYADEPKWVPLFNGKDLTGWTIKIAKRPLGENFANTFRVEDGILKVNYDGYEKFDEQYGHLFTNLAYSHYILRLEYRFHRHDDGRCAEVREPQQRRDAARTAAAEHAL